MLSQRTDEGYRMETLVGYSAIASVRGLWDQWVNHPNAHFDFFSVVAASRPSVVDPVAMVLYRGGKPVALAAGRLEKNVLPVSFGYLKLFRSRLLQYTIVYGGMMGEWEDRGSAVFIVHLMDWMRRERVDAVHLAATPREHPVFQAALRLVPAYSRDVRLNDNPHWSAEVSGTGEWFQKKINSKHLSQFRGKERKLAAFADGNIRIQDFRNRDDVSDFCRDAEIISQATYLRGLGEGFQDNPEMRNRVNLAADKGWLCGHILYVNEKPSAFWLGTLFREVLYLDYTGYLPELNAFSPGRILLVKMIESLCGRETVRSVDFGFGDAEYKRRYGDTCWKESDLYLFKKTPTLLAGNLARKSVKMLRISSERALSRFGLLARVKKRWRKAAVNSAPEAPSPQPSLFHSLERNP
jgi:Acetyltransferase (GNAT) domain